MSGSAWLLLVQLSPADSELALMGDEIESWPPPPPPPPALPPPPPPPAESGLSVIEDD